MNLHLASHNNISSHKGIAYQLSGEFPIISQGNSLSSNKGIPYHLTREFPIMSQGNSLYHLTREFHRTDKSFVKKEYFIQHKKNSHGNY